MVEGAAVLEGQLIAARSEMEGLKADLLGQQRSSAVATQARINELQQQLRRLGGVSENSTEDQAQSASDATYPSMRQLPILGVPFADKLRRMKVEESSLRDINETI